MSYVTRAQSNLFVPFVSKSRNDPLVSSRKKRKRKRKRKEDLEGGRSRGGSAARVTRIPWSEGSVEKIARAVDDETREGRSEKGERRRWYGLAKQKGGRGNEEPRPGLVNTPTESLVFLSTAATMGPQETKDERRAIYFGPLFRSSAESGLLGCLARRERERVREREEEREGEGNVERRGSSRWLQNHTP